MTQVNKKGQAASNEIEIDEDPEQLEEEEEELPLPVTLERVQDDHKLGLAQILAGQPGLDTSAFWAAAESRQGQASVPLEYLAWALRQFALNGQGEKAQRVFEALIGRFNSKALRMTYNNVYMRVVSLNKGELAEEIVNDAWLKLYRELINPEREPYLLAFATNFNYILLEESREAIRKEGYVKDWQEQAGETGKGHTRRVPRGLQDSLETPLPNFEDDSMSRADLVEDTRTPDAFTSYQESILLKELVPMLKDENRQILYWWLKGYNMTEIASFTGRDWETVKRRLNRIWEQAQPLISANKETQIVGRKPGRPRKNQPE